MSVGLVFCHGWGLSHRFWQPLRAALSDLPQAVTEAGYLGDTAPPIDWSQAEHWVLIGHSRGWAHAWQGLCPAPDSAPAPTWAGTVSLCGFTHVCARQAGEAGQAPRMVERMLKVLDTAPHAVLSDFLQRCGLGHLAPAPDQALNLTALRADLASLLSLDVTEAFSARPCPTLALAARDDVIVSPALSEQCFAHQPHAQLIWHEHGGHALGHVHADACAQHIRTFVQAWC